MSDKKAVITHEIASISLNEVGKVVIEMDLEDFKRRVLSTFSGFDPPYPDGPTLKCLGVLSYYKCPGGPVVLYEKVPGLILGCHHDDLKRDIRLRLEDFVRAFDKGIISTSTLSATEQNHAVNVIGLIRNQPAVVK